jgi:uncharacterized protein with von Willebrand factor type A (vWA) domain
VRKGTDIGKKNRRAKPEAWRDITVMWRADGTTLTDHYTARHSGTTILRGGRAVLTLTDGRDHDGHPVNAAVYGKVYRILIRPTRARQQYRRNGADGPEGTRERRID